MKVNPDTTAVVVVDMQNDFCHVDGALYAPPSNNVIQPITSIVEKARDAGATIVYTKDVHPEDQFDGSYYYDEFEQWGEHVVEGTYGAQIHDEFDVRDDDVVIEKQTYDAFHNTNLDEVLRENGINTLVICGTLANVCVLHTAGSAGLRDYKPIILEDAVGYITEEQKDDALEHADWLFGEVETSNNVTFN